MLKNFLAPSKPAAASRSRCTARSTNSPTSANILERAIADEPPAVATDPGIIRPGYHAELDELRNLSQHSKQDHRLHGRARAQAHRHRLAENPLQSGLRLLHRNFQAQSALAPADYERKQTLVNAERFTSPELKEYERKILAADERILEIERQLFIDLRSASPQQASRLRRTAAAVAQLDVLANLFAKLAADSAPQFTAGRNSTDRLRRTPVIVGGRHPVIEELLKQKGERFVPNDLCFEPGRQQFLLHHRPQHGRQIHLSSPGRADRPDGADGLLRPRAQAKLPITDRIFTRIGASDNLARGRSTFLVEMSEVAAILNHATPASLVLLDEVGRGTATFDGLSIAWAVVEHLQKHTRARTLFATHYHELTELADLLPGVKNVHVSVKKLPNEIIFLRRVEPGSADKSYGIEVARLAGLPRSVIERAREVLKPRTKRARTQRKTLPRRIPPRPSNPPCSPPRSRRPRTLRPPISTT